MNGAADGMRKRSLPAFFAVVLLTACSTTEKPPDVAGLITDLQSADPQKSGRANLELIRIGEPAVPALVEMLRGTDPRLRGLAASTLWGMGGKGRAAAPALGETLADPDPALRTSAAMALENMGPQAGDAIPALVKALSDSDNRVRQASVKALGAIGPAATPAIPVLTRALKKGSWPEAEEAILKIRGRPYDSVTDQ
jgi:HEAT repeat protein